MEYKLEPEIKQMSYEEIFSNVVDSDVLDPVIDIICEIIDTSNVYNKGFIYSEIIEPTIEARLIEKYKEDFN